MILTPQPQYSMMECGCNTAVSKLGARCISRAYETDCILASHLLLVVALCTEDGDFRGTYQGKNTTFTKSDEGVDDVPDNFILSN